MLLILSCCLCKVVQKVWTRQMKWEGVTGGEWPSSFPALAEAEVTLPWTFTDDMATCVWTSCNNYQPHTIT